MKAENVRDIAFGLFVVFGALWILFSTIICGLIIDWFRSYEHLSTVWIPKSYQVVGLNVTGPFRRPYISVPENSVELSVDSYQNQFGMDSQLVFLYQDLNTATPGTEVRYMTQKEDKYYYSTVVYYATVKDIEFIFNDKDGRFVGEGGVSKFWETEPRNWTATIGGSLTAILVLAALSGAGMLFVVNKSKHRLAEIL